MCISALSLLFALSPPQPLKPASGWAGGAWAGGRGSTSPPSLSRMRSLALPLVTSLYSLSLSLLLSLSLSLSVMCVLWMI